MIPQILYIFSPPEPDLTFGIIITLINQSIKNSKKYLLVSKITSYIKVAYNFFSWKKISASNTHIEMNTRQKYTKKNLLKSSTLILCAIFPNILMKKFLYRLPKNRFSIYTCIKYDNVTNSKYIPVHKANTAITNNTSFFSKLIYAFTVTPFPRISNWIFIFCIL